VRHLLNMAAFLAVSMLLLSSMTRLVLFALPAVLIARMPGFEIKHIWYLSVTSQMIQAGINLLLLRRELRKKLNFDEAAGMPAMAG